MSNLIKHAREEFRAAGWTDENGVYKDEMQEAICTHVLKLLEVFSDEGHSGSTAPYALNMFTTLANFKPVAPLTGEDWEWVDHGHTKQNKRCSSVFMDPDGECYNIDGRVFWEWNQRPIDEDEEGYPGMHAPHKSYYTCRESRVPVTFPYTVPKEPEYVYRYSDAEPHAPKQNEQGLL